jgi:hypothetical protein
VSRAFDPARPIVRRQRAIVGGLHQRDFLGACANPRGESLQNRQAALGAKGCPCREGATSGGDSGIDLFGAAGRDIRERWLRSIGDRSSNVRVEATRFPSIKCAVETGTPATFVVVLSDMIGRPLGRCYAIPRCIQHWRKRTKTGFV